MVVFSVESPFLPSRGSSVVAVGPPGKTRVFFSRIFGSAKDPGSELRNPLLCAAERHFEALLDCREALLCPLRRVMTTIQNRCHWSTGATPSRPRTHPATSALPRGTLKRCPIAERHSSATCAGHDNDWESLSLVHRRHTQPPANAFCAAERHFGALSDCREALFCPLSNQEREQTG